MLDYLKTRALMAAYTYSRNNRAPASRHQYTSTADFVLDRGETIEGQQPLTAEQLGYLTHVARGLTFEPKQCYKNSMSLVLRDARGRVVYVEGYCDSGMIPVEHAWVLLDGKPVDLTRSLRKEAAAEFIAGCPPQADLADRVLGVIPADWHYRGVLFNRAAVREYVYEREQYGSMIDDWEGGHPLFELERLGNFDAPDPDDFWAAMESG